jgi:hypothetical protein
MCSKAQRHKSFRAAYPHLKVPRLPQKPEALILSEEEINKRKVIILTVLLQLFT